MLDRILNALTRYKILFDRTRNYIGYFQFFVTIYVALKISGNSPVRRFMFEWWFLTFPAILGVCLVFGYIEKLLRIREREQKNYTQANPEWTRLMEKIDEILKK
jgi:hypothetical protein